MTAASAVLVRLRELGAEVAVKDRRLRIVSPVELPPQLLADVRAVRPMLAELLAAEGSRVEEYRRLIHRCFELIAQGEAADPDACRSVLAESSRVADDLGAAAANSVRRDVARQWHRERGLCPYCSARGAFHDPDTEVCGGPSTR